MSNLYSLGIDTNDFLELHTSDRILFKRCRRKWNFRSPLRMHLVYTDGAENKNLWTGSGLHFGLEDFHGFKRFASPDLAVEAYFAAFKPEEKPIEADDMLGLLAGMLDYYQMWLENREVFKTVWLPDPAAGQVPQVEVQFRITMPELSNRVGKTVYYQGAFDRLAEDEESRGWWVEDYKTAASIDVDKLETDPQISAYSWAADVVYEQFGKRIEGVLYTQFAKKVPQLPEPLVKGGFSKNKAQKTTYRMYRRALMDAYGKIPPEYNDILSKFAENETVEGDAFIRRDRVYRNDYSRATAYQQIMQEAVEMLDPDIAIYPNPTRDCKWDCEFRTVCLAMDDGGDWESLVETMFEKKGDEPEWRQRIKYPEPQIVMLNSPPSKC